jgi:sugar/nucleoside kinase (ribokinase family)
MKHPTNALCYLSIDEVNIALARQLAGACGIDIEPIEPRDLPALDGARVILDWDSIPAEDRDRALQRCNVRAIHGYSLDDARAGFLPERGILISRRLDRKLFEALIRPMSPPSTSPAALVPKRHLTSTAPHGNAHGNGPALARVVVGGVCVDRFATGEEIVLDAKNPVRSGLTALGGRAANIALASKRLAPESPVLVLAHRGDDLSGDFVARSLRERGIVLPLPPLAGAATSFSYIVTHAGTGRSTFFCEPGACSEPLPLDEVERALAGAEVLWLAAPPWNEVIRSLSTSAARRRVPLFFGLGRLQIDKLGYQALGKELAGPVEMLSCNRPEAEKFTGRALVAEQLEALRYGGLVRTVVITDEANGIHAWRDGKTYHVPVYGDPRRPIVDDTGAGDAAQATIGHLLLRGWALAEALRGGVRQGFECCTAVGTNVCLLDGAGLEEYLAGTVEMDGVIEVSG